MLPFTKFPRHEWSELRDSNPRQPPWQGGTLPTELSSPLFRRTGHSISYFDVSMQGGKLIFFFFLSLLLHSLDYRFKKKKPATSYSRTGESRTTLGDGALNFRVRNGNGCDNSSMATGKKPLFELGTKEKYNFWRDERGWNPLSRKVKFLIYI